MGLESGGNGLGDVLAFQILSLNFIQPFSTIIVSGSHLATARSNFDRINDILDHKVDLPSEELNLEREKVRKRIYSRSGQTLSGQIELRHVTFGYDKTRDPLIKDLSLTINPKQRVVLLGKSGSGKSTLAQLVCGLIKPWEGEILFDGEELNTISRDILAQSLSYVNQDIALFEGSIRDNLSLWNPTILEQDMIAALHTACIDKQVNELPGRVDARVLPGGSNFSGGERQRIELARALTNSPSILVLDEATSALDPIVEAQIESRLRCEGYTCLVIAHRLSTVRNADQLVVLEKGQIVERGRHEELKDQKGPYSQLLSSTENSLL